MAGDLEFGIVQSDRQYQAINGLAEWKDAGKQEKLRAICSFHPESINKGEHLGLMGMQERTEMLGGVLSLTSII